MAVCPKCRKQIPDDAAHCGYCGATLHAAAPLVEKKTMFGYSPAAQQPARTARPSSQPAQPARPSTAQPAPAARTAGHVVQPRTPHKTSPEEAMAKTQYGGSNVEVAPEMQQAIDAATERADRKAVGKPVMATIMQQGMPAPAALRRSTAHEAQSRDQIPPTRFGAAAEPAAPARGAEIPATVYAQQAAQPSRTSRSHGQVIPATVAAMPSQPAAAQVAQPAQPVIAPGLTTDPGREPSRPVLASESLAEDRAPAEPGRAAMRVLMAICGLLLFGLFAAPMSDTAEGMRFSWHFIPNLVGLSLVNQLYLVAGGVLFLAAALIPIPFVARALAGAVVGMGALGLLMASASGDWRSVATVSVCFLLPAALFHRWRYRGSLFARLLVAVCVLAVLAVLLVPAGAGVPLLGIFDGLGSAGGAAIVSRLYPLLLLLLGLLSLLAFLGSGSTGLAQIWAVLVLLYLPLQAGLAVLLEGTWTWTQVRILYGNLALLIYLVIAANGLSQIMAAASRSSRA